MVSKCPRCQIVRRVKLSSLHGQCQIVLGVKLSAVSNCPITPWSGSGVNIGDVKEEEVVEKVTKMDFFLYFGVQKFSDEIVFNLCVL